VFIYIECRWKFRKLRRSCSVVKQRDLRMFNSMPNRRFFGFLDRNIWKCSSFPGEDSQKNWVGVYVPLPKTITLFMTKFSDFSYPIYDPTKYSMYPTCIYHRCSWHSCPKDNFWRAFVRVGTKRGPLNLDPLLDPLLDPIWTPPGPPSGLPFGPPSGPLLDPLFSLPENMGSI